MGKKKAAGPKKKAEPKEKKEPKAKAEPKVHKLPSTKKEEKRITAAEAGEGILPNIEQILDNAQAKDHEAILSIHKGTYRQG